jgi:hypothetical protein
MADLPRRASFPKETRRTPAAISSLYDVIEGPVTVDFFESSPLPKIAKLASGEEVRPAKARAALLSAFQLLGTTRDSLTLGDMKVIPQILAERLDLQVITSQDGVPIILGAHLRAGDKVEVIGIVSDPKDVDYAIGNALWRLRLKQQTRLGVAFACIAGAFCPAAPALPERLEGSWPDPVAKALARVQAPFESFRAEVKEDLAGLGVHPFAVETYDPMPERASVLVLAGATQALTADEEAWLRERVDGGTALLVLAPGVRLRATAREFVPVGAGESGLLAYLGVQREHALLADRAALLPFRVPGGPGAAVAAMPLAAEISRVQELHPAVAGMTGQMLPLAGTFTAPPTSKVRPLAWTRGAAVPVRLPADATESAIRDAAPPRGAGAEPGVVILAREFDETRQMVVGSDLGLMAMSASKLIARLHLKERAKTSSVDQLVGDLAAYERAAKTYGESAAANRSLRRGALKVLANALLWCAEPKALRGLRRGSSGPE